MMWTLGDIIQYWKNNNQLKCNLLLTEPLGLLAGLGKCVEGLQLEFLNFDIHTLGKLTLFRCEASLLVGVSYVPYVRHVKF